MRRSWVGTSEAYAGRPASTAAAKLGCSSSRTGGSPATTERQTTCAPATYDAGRASNHRPSPSNLRAVAETEARTARRDSTTRFGVPVEPDVSTTRGSSSEAVTQADSAATTSAVEPRRSTPLTLVPGGWSIGSRPAKRWLPPSLLDRTVYWSLVATPRQWLAGARPRTLPAAVSPVLAGTGVAAYVADAVWWKALLALVVSLALQVAVNYANDYSDGIRGTDADRVGPMRLVGSGVASPAAVKRAAFLAFGVAGLAGLVLAASTAWWLVAVGVVSVLAAWYYTGGSRPYGYLGLGEVMVFVFFGLVAVLGTTYVQTETFELPALYAAIGVGALACAILVVNNLRDIPTDTVSGKRTLAVVLGADRTRALYLLLVLAAAAACVAVAVSTTWWALVGLGFLAPALRGVRTVLSGAVGPALIPVLQSTGLAELAWAVLVAVPLIVAG